MNAREALRASIEKWERNVAQERAEDIEMGAKSCPLCNLFNHGPARCVGCPVYEFTRRPSCERTPYEDVLAARFGVRGPIYEGLRQAMQAEVDFLRSLETDDVA